MPVRAVGKVIEGPSTSDSLTAYCYGADRFILSAKDDTYGFGHFEPNLDGWQHHIFILPDLLGIGGRYDIFVTPARLNLLRLATGDKKGIQ